MFVRTFEVQQVADNLKDIAYNTDTAYNDLNTLIH